MGSGVVGNQRVTELKLHDSRRLRKIMTPAELQLWEKLRDRQCGGFKFRRQQVIEGFIADFYCEAANLAVEADGSVHESAENIESDKHRDEVFRARQILTLRFSNTDIEKKIENVLVRIKLTCEARITSVKTFTSPAQKAPPSPEVRGKSRFAEEKSKVGEIWF